jgi:hypothetical protein
MLVVGHGFDSLDSPGVRPCNQGRWFTPLTIHGTWGSIRRVFRKYISLEKMVDYMMNHFLDLAMELVGSPLFWALYLCHFGTMLTSYTQENTHTITHKSVDFSIVKVKHEVHSIFSI